MLVGGLKIIESVEGWSFLVCFGHISIKIMLKINCEWSERRKNCDPLDSLVHGILYETNNMSNSYKTGKKCVHITHIPPQNSLLISKCDLDLEFQVVMRLIIHRCAVPPCDVYLIINGQFHDCQSWSFITVNGQVLDSFATVNHDHL